MLIFAVILLAQAAFFLLYSLIQQKIGLGALLIQTMFTAQYLLVEFDLGPVSLRVYCCAILLVITVGCIPSLAHRLSSTPGALPILGTWLAYLGWYFVSSVVNGSLQDPSTYFISFLSVYLLPTLVFLSMLAVLRTEADLHSSVLWLAIIALANAGFSILQAAGYTFAWDVHRMLYPIRAITTEDQRLRVGSWFVDGWPPGLSSYSIATGFVMICFGVLWTTFAAHLWHRRRFVLAACALLAAVLVEGGNVTSMSRSSIYLFPAGLLLALMLRGQDGARSRVLLTSGFAVVALLVLAYLAKTAVDLSISENRTIELARIYDLSDSNRLDLIYQALIYASDHILFGGAEQALKEGAIALTPHNFLVNALLWAGAPGFLLMSALGFLILYHTYIQPVYTMTPHGPSGALAHGLAISLVMYLAKGMLHSDSFTTGGTIGWHLLGLWVVARSLSLSHVR